MLYSNIPSCRVLQKSIEDIYSITKTVESRKDSQKIVSKLQKVAANLTQCLNTFKINHDSYRDMQIDLRQTKDKYQKIQDRFMEILLNLQMLIYQKDYQILKIRISEYKINLFEDIEDIEESLNSTVSILNKAVYTNKSSQSIMNVSKINSRKQLSPTINLSQMLLNMNKQQSIEESFKIVNDSDVNFENKHQKWLNLMQKDLDQEELEHITDQQLPLAYRNRHLNAKQCGSTDFIITENPKNDNLFAGKKISSMTLLKQKSVEKYRNLKTSAKKKQRTQIQNVQGQTFKKKLFAGKPQVQRSFSKRKMSKQTSSTIKTH